MKQYNNILLMPDAAEGTLVDAASWKVGDKCSWNNEAGDDIEGTIVAFTDDNHVIVEDENGKKGKIGKDDINPVQSGEEVLEVTPEGIKCVKMSYRDEKKPNPKNVNLKGYSFAAPRFPSVEVLLQHLDNALKSQNKHKTQDEDKGTTAADIILEQYHSAQNNKLRTRVKNEAQESLNSAVLRATGKTDVDQLSIEDYKTHGDTWKNGKPNVLFSPAQALNWIPSIREPGIQSQQKAAILKIQELQRSGVEFTDERMQNAFKELAALTAPK